MADYQFLGELTCHLEWYLAVGFPLLGAKEAVKYEKGSGSIENRRGKIFSLLKKEWRVKRKNKKPPEVFLLIVVCLIVLLKSISNPCENPFKTRFTIYSSVFKLHKRFSLQYYYSIVLCRGFIILATKLFFIRKPKAHIFSRFQRFVAGVINNFFVLVRTETRSVLVLFRSFSRN